MTKTEKYLQSVNRRLWRSYRYVRNACATDAATRTFIGPPFYTDHGIRHSERMLKYFDVFLHNPFFPSLVTENYDRKQPIPITVEDIFAILCAIFAHDIGMRGSSIILFNQPLINEREYARIIHALRSQKFLENSQLIQWDEGIFPLEWRKIIGRICAMHNSPIVILNDNDNYGVNEHFCACILKLLDCLDITNARLALGDIRTEKTPMANMIHAWAHYYVEDINIICHSICEQDKFWNSFGFLINYSFPIAWRHKIKNKFILIDNTEILDAMRVMAEKNLRKIHTDVQKILYKNNIKINNEIKYSISYSDYDLDGAKRADFLEYLQNKECNEIAVKYIIECQRSSASELSVDQATIADNGAIQCVESLNVIFHLQKFPDLAISPNLFPDPKAYSIVIKAFAQQGILILKDSDKYCLSRNNSLWINVQNWMKNIAEDA